MNDQQISTFSKILLTICALSLVVSIFVPLWNIQLDAPQYPEGLALKIYTFKLGGDVEIINGLNHYIGMQTLHAENFIEFTLLPYIIVTFALFFLISAIVNRKKMLYASFTAFVLFGIVAMVDFWRWEYNYGHNLDPHAAIIVPGMAYQPPLIGFKQLLNFGAYSIPDTGGWLFLFCGSLLLFSVSFEKGLIAKLIKQKKVVAGIFSLFLYLGCTSKEPLPIRLHKDNCDFCKMTIADGRFAAEVITKKGRVYKFDDINCMNGYLKENKNTHYSGLFINDYTSENVLIDAEKAYFIYSEDLRSPMGGNMAAFAAKEKADKFADMWNAEIKEWKNLSNINK